MEEELCRRLDVLSKEKGTPRAQVIRDACRQYLWRLEQERLDREYVEGYKRIPEDPRVFQAYAAMTADILPEEDWSDWDPPK